MSSIGGAGAGVGWEVVYRCVCEREEREEIEKFVNPKSFGLNII